MAVMSAVSHETLAWVNPDGTQGVAEQYFAPASAFEHAWVNPDGHRSLPMTALNGGHHADSVRPTIERLDVAPYNDQQPFYPVTKRNDPSDMLTFLLAMLVAGSSLLLARKLWPH
jgi:hypothetical protein